MKTLYAVRHAKSSWDNPFLDDFSRPLNDRGRRDAPRMALRLKERQIRPTLLLSSPAERALSTCLLIADSLGYSAAEIEKERKLYHASDEQILGVVRALDDIHGSAMIFSHNPGLTEFVNRVSREEVTDNIPTCGVVSIFFRVDSWKDLTWSTGLIDFFDYPKKQQ